MGLQPYRMKAVSAPCDEAALAASAPFAQSEGGHGRAALLSCRSLAGSAAARSRAISASERVATCSAPRAADRRQTLRPDRPAFQLQAQLAVKLRWPDIPGPSDEQACAAAAVPLPVHA